MVGSSHGVKNSIMQIILLRHCPNQFVKCLCESVSNKYGEEIIGVIIIEGNCEVGAISALYRVETSQTNTQKLYILCLKILHCCVLPFCKYR